MLRQTLYQLASQRQLRQIATHNRLARRMVRRFVAGDTLDEALQVIGDINHHGMTATLDHLGENVTSIIEAQEATNAACSAFDAIARDGLDSNVSVKLTQLGLDVSEELALEHMKLIAAKAEEHRSFVRIDMEASQYVDRTLDIFFRVFEDHQNAGVVIQSMLIRSQSDLERLIEARARVRLVKGAYLEPPAAAYQRKVDVDASFVRLMEMLMERGNYPAIATHDERMIEATKSYADIRGVTKDQFEFQMLYGIRRDLQSMLVREGYRLRVYVPYGTYWYPYLVRRLAERPANVMFFLGNVAREAAGRR